MRCRVQCMHAHSLATAVFAYLRSPNKQGKCLDSANCTLLLKLLHIIICMGNLLFKCNCCILSFAWAFCLLYDMCCSMLPPSDRLEDVGYDVALACEHAPGYESACSPIMRFDDSLSGMNACY